MKQLSDIVELARHPLDDGEFRSCCKQRLDHDGVLTLPGFLTPLALSEIAEQSRNGQQNAYFCKQSHSVYLGPDDEAYAPDHPNNRKVISSKGCICDDDVASDSSLRQLYNAPEFRQFIMAVTGETALHPYADRLSSINIHYANRGEELGWHFDNSEFAITLLIAKPEAGSRFEYVKDLRDAEAGDMSYQQVEKLLDGEMEPEVLEIESGTLVLFRGRNSIHRVSPNESDTTRMLAVLAYNSEPGIELSPNARMTFYGRLS